MMNKKHKAISFQIMMAILLIGGVAAFFIAFFAGSSGFGPNEFAAMLRGEAAPSVSQIFFEIRAPRALIAYTVGAALALSGCAMQGIFQNPMADPFVLGISSGAALGATLAISLGWGSGVFGIGATAAMAFLFGLASIFVVYHISRIAGRVSTFSLLLSGFALSALLSALTYFVMLLNHDKMENVLSWNMGSFTAASWERLWLLLPVCVVCAVLLCMHARPLNIMLSGDEVSSSLGVDTHKSRRSLLIITAVLCAAAVSVSGVIGFVGLMVPHLLRLIVGPDHRKLLPLCIVGGGMYLLLCDTLAKLLLDGMEIPVGIITSILGVPFFIWLLRRGGRGEA